MLLLKRLEIDGFGPFVNRQEIVFPTEHGITVVYGENMRGKTSLLNAVRYAFFGEAKGRGARSKRRTSSLINRDFVAQGKHEFQISLEFSYDGEDYELHRRCSGVGSNPVHDEDFEEEIFLRRGADVLGPQERDRALKTIFPDEVSRFFLFDGELLQEYEELLVSDSETGKKISEAIERILGVPILKRSRLHLVQMRDDAESQAAREAQRDKKTQAFGAALQVATELRDGHLREVARKEEELAELTARRTQAEDAFRRQQRLIGVLQQRDAAVSRRAEAQNSLLQKQADLQRAMADSWRSLLSARVLELQANAVASVRADVDTFAVLVRRQAIASLHCPACDQNVSSEVAERLKALDTDSDMPAVPTSVAMLGDLGRFRTGNNLGEIKLLHARIAELQREIVTLAESISDLETQLGDSEADDLRGTQSSFSELGIRIGITRTAIANERAAAEQQDASVQRIARQLEAVGAFDLRIAQGRAQTLRDAADVFGAAIERYKRQLREKVASSASSLFLAMTTEKQDYTSLAINESYGLEIIHRDGRAEEARSAGAEHVVALALIGALQSNAPLRGPIVMDSPFGRLDAGHTANVVKALPQMARQVILLVYESEVGRSQVRELLGRSLRREYQLDRVSARQTTISLVR